MKIFKIQILILLFRFNLFNNKKDLSNNSNILNKPLSKTNIDKHEDKDTKEISIDVLEDFSKSVISNNYINLPDEEMKYLKKMQTQFQHNLKNVAYQKNIL